MSVNKVQLANGETIIDISDSTVTPETLAEGVTAHDASGQKITGKMVQGGGTSVQTDWNQTDETAPDFLKNKPFGDMPVVVVEEQELVYDAEMGGAGAIPINPIQDGENLTVVWDGDTYNLTATFYGALGSTLFGNLALAELGEDTGEPFLGIFSQGMLAFIYSDQANHTLEISKTAIVQIPAKYINKGIIFYVSADEYVYTDSLCQNRATQNDLLTAINNEGIQLRRVAFSTPVAMMTLLSIFIIKQTTYSLCAFDLIEGKIKTYYSAEYVPETTT